MRHDVLIALSLASMLGLAGTAVGQQPAPPADYGVPITNEQAKAVAAAAVAEAKKSNSPMAFAIVGPAGELVYFEKMDGAQLASVEIAHGRARTAVLFRRHSKAFADQYRAGNRAFTTLSGNTGGIRRRRSDYCEWQNHRRDRGDRHRLARRRGSAVASSWRQDHATRCLDRAQYRLDAGARRHGAGAATGACSCSVRPARRLRDADHQ